MHSRIHSFLFIGILLLSAAAAARADHGPGTSGGGVMTQSGETLKPGDVAIGVRWDFTSFDNLSAADIRDQTLDVDADDHIHFDVLRWSLLQTVDVAYGAAEDFQIGGSLGWYRGTGLREGHIHGNGTYGFHDLGDVSGTIDPWFNAKYRFLKGPAGNVSVFAGVKLPMGRDDVRGEGDDEPLEPALQPGSGAFDFQIGLAYSRWLTERITLDVSAGRVFRTEANDFRIGDRTEGGIALAYRLMEDVKTRPNVSFFFEANLRHLDRNEEEDEEVVNSGGTVLFLSPGVRCAFSDRVNLSVAPQFPVVQALNDEQQETSFKLSVGLTFSF